MICFVRVGSCEGRWGSVGNRNAGLNVSPFLYFEGESVIRTWMRGGGWEEEERGKKEV